MKMVKCSVKFCYRSASTDMGISFFRFPAEGPRCDEWMKALGRPDLVGINAEKLHNAKYRVCGMHFHNSSFSSMLLNRLKKEALPINFPIQARPGPYFEGDEKELEKMMLPNSGNNLDANSSDNQGCNENNVSDKASQQGSEVDSKHEEQSEVESDERKQLVEAPTTSDGKSDTESSDEKRPGPSEGEVVDGIQSENTGENPDNNFTENGETNGSDTSENKETENSGSPVNENSETNGEEPAMSKTKEAENSEHKQTDISEADKSEDPESKEIEDSKCEDVQQSEVTDTSENPEKSQGKDVENPKNEIVQNGVSENAKDDDKRMEIDDNEDDDDYFNPLLLCPDISMDVDESPVLTESSEPSQMNDATDANSLFAPLFSTFVDEMTGAEISFNLTSEEQQLREKLYGPNNPIQFTKIHCTACNVHLGSALAGQSNRFVHPLLKVLICKECYHFYTSGEFEKDEDGSELYCRWCGQGGQVLCCTMCEFVFCKKCIRINFGRKKLTQVRDSEEWKCFRCDMSQLKALRAMCVEFFEYIRRERARASTYTDSDIVNKDLTNCCQSQTKKRNLVEAEKELEKEVVRKPKRRKVEEDDPDYNPFVKEADDRSNSPIPSTSGVKAVSTPATSKTLTTVYPRATVDARHEVSFPGKSPSSAVRFGNTVISVKSVEAVTAQTPSPSGSRNTAIRSSLTNTRPRPTFTPRTPNQSAVRPPLVSVPAIGSIAHIRATSARPQAALTPPVMKHEWFEKTVRAAARVNSNLSYTLTQLNKAQSSASSVEQLAVVHNKLQEILSSSINSLIQIRKNLRTEFIAGIKTIKFPPKPPAVINSNDDDDVIIINPEPSTPSTNKGNIPCPPLSSISRSSKTSTPVSGNIVNSEAPSSGKGYLKVKSFSQLLKVTSECITIPDDDPPVPDREPIVVEINDNDEETRNDKNIEENKNTAKSNENSSHENKDDEVEEENKEKENPKDVEEENKEKENPKDVEESENSVTQVTDESEKKKDKSEGDENGHTETNGNSKSSEDTGNCNGKMDEDVQVKTEPEENSYNVKEQPTPQIRRMLSVKVNLKKTCFVEDLVKREPVENGDN